MFNEINTPVVPSPTQLEHTAVHSAKKVDVDEYKSIQAKFEKS